jgi:hypothetical protein
MGFSLGSISTGTLRTEDLLSAFVDTLERLSDSKADRKLAKQGRKALSRLVRTGDDEQAEYIREELFDRLNELAPPYVYFGSTEGDGADIGFFPSWDSIEEDRRTGELSSGEETSEAAEIGSLFLTVSDHGNAELYRHTADGWESLWSVV